MTQAVVSVVVLTLLPVALLFTCVALYRSLAAAFGGPTKDAILPEDDVAALSDEKAAVLRSIKDIAYEHALGKLSEGDFARLDQQYRARARAILRAEDQDLGPYRAEAEARIEAAIEGGRATAPPDETFAVALAQSEREQSAALVCAACGTENDADAIFCKRCASRVGANP